MNLEITYSEMSQLRQMITKELHNENLKVGRNIPWNAVYEREIKNIAYRIENELPASGREMHLQHLYYKIEMIENTIQKLVGG